MAYKSTHLPVMTAAVRGTTSGHGVRCAQSSEVEVCILSEMMQWAFSYDDTLVNNVNKCVY